jgi:alkylation response protein AidB-like acyl-CoA dehydrogenase
MYLSPTDDEQQIIDATAQTLVAEAPIERWFRPQTNAASEEARLLAVGAALGWMGIATPADIGGGDATIVDEVLLFRELGRHLAPVNLMAGAIGAQVALQAGKRELASSIVAGTACIGLFANCGSILLGSAGARYGLDVDGDALMLRQLDAVPERTQGLDWTTTTARIGAPAPTVICRIENSLLALRTRLLLAAQLQGIAEVALTQSVAYAKLREQFGRPIGSFQAIRHKCADMAIRVERARAQLFFAAVAHRDQPATCAFQILAAQTLAEDAARVNARTNIFIHGAIGVTTENAGHLLLKRSMLWAFVTDPRATLLEALADAPPGGV